MNVSNVTDQVTNLLAEVNKLVDAYPEDNQVERVRLLAVALLEFVTTGGGEAKGQ